jgi:pimeloyl-ACP methyl ester carboxylesterase
VRNIFVDGINSLLGTYFAARCLQESDDWVFYCESTDPFAEEDITDFVVHAACQISEGTGVGCKQLEIAHRLRRVGRDLKVRVPSRAANCIHEVWHFANVGVCRNQAEMLKSLIVACNMIGAEEFNYVEFDNHPKKPIGDILTHHISELCEAQKIGCRFFRASLIVGSGHPRLRQSRSDLSQFLSILHSFKAEIVERSPQYFDLKALRCLAPRDAALNLVSADVASELLLRIGRADGTLGSHFAIVNPHNTQFSAVCERVGAAYGLGILSVEDFDALNAIDRAFHERSGGFCGGFDGRSTGKMLEAPNTDAFRMAGLPPDRALLDEESQIGIFEGFRRSQDEDRAEVMQRVADLSNRLATKTITRDGSFHYYVGGIKGPVVVLLNALGQGLECWSRLMDNLMQSHRVIIWEARGTVSPHPPFGLTDQVNDLDAILRQENVETCHLVGWCTGPKVAINFYLGRPSAVRSMAFLNGTFKCHGSLEEFDSPYEQNLDSLCRMLVRKPSLAGSVMKTLRSMEEESEIDVLNVSDSEQMSVSVLSRMNLELKTHVLAPFRTEETTLNYAHQLIDFWSHDTLPKAHGVRVPVLLMGTEYDQVATPASSQMAAGFFPNSRHVHVRGATHYCLYDRADFVGELLKKFFETPDDVLVYAAQDEMAVRQ